MVDDILHWIARKLIPRRLRYWIVIDTLAECTVKGYPDLSTGYISVDKVIDFTHNRYYMR